jgi:hypothetical protein
VTNIALNRTSGQHATFHSSAAQLVETRTTPGAEIDVVDGWRPQPNRAERHAGRRTSMAIAPTRPATAGFIFVQ